MSTVAIYRGPTKGYSLTDTDVLWLARALVGEAGEDCTRREAEFHFWCWMDRFLLVRGRWLTEGWEFHSLLRAHSQAINPLWMTPGEGQCAAHPSDCSADRIARRARVCSYSAAQLQSFGVYAFALAAQNGTLDRPTAQTLYDFAACSLVERQGRPCSGINVAGQCFLPYDCLKDSEKKAVVPGNVEMGTTVKTLGISALGVIFGAAVLWAIWKLKPWKRLGK